VADIGAVEAEGLTEGGALATETFQEAVAPMATSMAEAVPVIATAVATAAMPEPVEVLAAAPVVAMPAPVVTAPVVAQAPLAAPALAASVAAPAVAAPAVPFVLPMDSLQAVAESAGLQWVNSDADKIRAVQAAMDSEPAPAHVPRERKPVAAVDEGPLVLVETRKDLSQFKLPFETTQGSSQPNA
jgi:ribonuclease E